jgi:hypothetical protein
MNKKLISTAMILVGVGLAVFAFSDYTPPSDGSFAGWSDSCRYAMTVGAMLVTGGKLL